MKNAIDSELFIANRNEREKVRKEFGLENQFVVGHVGRMHPQKNHDFLIDVFSEIKKKKQNAKLVLIGTGPLKNKLRKKIQYLGLSEYVIFLGNRKDINRLYQAMDVFIFPSLFEGLGIVSIEAQAAGIPVLCSEGLPPETNITPIYHMLMLKEGAEVWAQSAIDIAKTPLAHSNMQEYIIDSGFDMKVVAEMMEKYYLSKDAVAKECLK